MRLPRRRQPLYVEAPVADVVLAGVLDVVRALRAVRRHAPRRPIDWSVDDGELVAVVDGRVLMLGRRGSLWTACVGAGDEHVAVNPALALGRALREQR